MTSPRTIPIRLAAAATLAALTLAGCGGTDEGATPTQTSATTSATPSETMTSPSATAPSAPPSTSPSSESPSASPSPSDTPSQTPTTKPVVVKVTIKAGEVRTGSVDVPVLAGDNVRLVVRTDVADELHVHGVEQTFPLEVGKNTIDFQIAADLAPGLYEVETHTAALLLFNLVVT